MNAFEKLVTDLGEKLRESERMATADLAAKILVGLDPHNRDAKIQRVVKEAVEEVWEQRGLEYHS